MKVNRSDKAQAEVDLPLGVLKASIGGTCNKRLKYLTEGNKPLLG